MTNQFADAVKSILWLVIEDHSGLWEVLWEMNASFPEMPQKQRFEVAAEALKTMHARGWISVYYCSEPYGSLANINGDNLDELLNDRANWEPVEQKAGVTSIRVGATEQGKNAYQNGEYGHM